MGQLENNHQWEVVFTDVSYKEAFLGRRVVRGQEATVGDLQRKPRLLRIQRIPLCVPNEYIEGVLRRCGLSVSRVEYQKNKTDNLISNTRCVLVDSDKWDCVPDYLSWAFDSLKGVALQFLQSRPPKCHRCNERGYKFFERVRPYILQVLPQGWSPGKRRVS